MCRLPWLQMPPGLSLVPFSMLGDVVLWKEVVTSRIDAVFSSCISVSGTWCGPREKGPTSRIPVLECI